MPYVDPHFRYGVAARDARKADFKVRDPEGPFVIPRVAQIPMILIAESVVGLGYVKHPDFISHMRDIFSRAIDNNPDMVFEIPDVPAQYVFRTIKAMDLLFGSSYRVQAYTLTEAQDNCRIVYSSGAFIHASPEQGKEWARAHKSPARAAPGVRPAATRRRLNPVHRKAPVRDQWFNLDTGEPIPNPQVRMVPLEARWRPPRDVPPQRYCKGYTFAPAQTCDQCGRHTVFLHPYAMSVEKVCIHCARVHYGMATSLLLRKAKAEGVAKLSVRFPSAILTDNYYHIYKVSKINQDLEYGYVDVQVYTWENGQWRPELKYRVWPETSPLEYVRL